MAITPAATFSILYFLYSIRYFVENDGTQRVVEDERGQNSWGTSPDRRSSDVEMIRQEVAVAVAAPPGWTEAAILSVVGAEKTV